MHRIAVKVGGEVVGIYTDVLPWRRLGTLHVERASHVEFDAGRQGWTVTLSDGTILPGIWPLREDALREEHEAVERLL
jgi:hypothetical protein